MSRPIILYRSMLRSSGVTISDPGTASGSNRANLSDLKAYEGWLSSTTTAPQQFDIDAGSAGENADSLLLVFHTLHSLGATVRVLWGATYPATNEVLIPTLPAQDEVTYLPFTAPGSKRYWRVELNYSGTPFPAPPFIGELLLGMKLTLPEYLSPGFQPFFSGKEVAGSRSEGGHYLGATIRGKTHRGTISLGGDAGVSRAAFTSDLNAFIDSHLEHRKPFGFIVDADDSELATPSWVKLRDDAEVQRRAVGSSWQRLSLEFDVEEAFMEPVT